MIDDRFDRLASLFLGDHEPTSTGGMEAVISRAASSASREGAAVITPLVPGNLPVLAHPWIWHVAARLDARPSALIRMAGDGVQVAMLNATGVAESACGDLAAWLLQAATVARRWFVVPRSGGEIDTVSALEADEAVVVSGGDEAATVAAYQWVRRLVESAKNAGRSAPLTPIAIVGCEEGAAKEAAATVSTASQAFLQQPVPLAGAFPRLERTAVSEQRFYGEVVQPAELLAAIRTAGAAAWARGAAPGAPQPAQAVPRPVAPSVLRPAPTPPAAPAFAEATPSVAASAPAPVLPAVSAPLVAAGLPEAIAPCMPGLWPVAIRCPGHPQIEFATDESGRLHLLAWIDQAASLRPARAWAQRHAAILRAGFPGLAADPLPLVERLVFTDATRAIEWHHTGVRLDLLVRAAAGWTHVPLNDERSMQP
ncbi:MAG: hypothetical protein ACOYMI_04085 [Phycisphaerales bacterium]